MDPVVGIDLGTTHSSVATLTDSGPALIGNPLGETLTPSVVGLDEEGRLVVGATARELRVTRPERCASLFKRFMGSDWSVTLGDQKFSAEALSSAVLTALKADAEAHLGRPITRAVVTVPAYFSDRQRKATIAAARIAGLEVERILNEPTAAALAYGFHESEEDKTLLVFDLGGGTFDVSVVELFDGAIEVRSSTGESFLGGEDFTRALAARLLEKAGKTFEHTELESPLLVARLIQQCESAKRVLSREATAAVRMPDAQGNFPEGGPVFTVERGQFEEWTRHLLNRVELPIRRVLGDAKLSREKIDEVILVGGATRMPMVAARVAELLGKPPRCRLNPEEVVARGAAVQAGLFADDRSVRDLVVTDVAPFTLGIEISKRFGTERCDGYFLPIIERNTTIPVSRVHRVSTTHPNQTTVSINVFQGESRRVEGNLQLGSFDLNDIPRGPAGQEVDVRFTYDLNGVLEVEATVVETQRTAALVITRYAQGLSPEAIQDAVRAMAQLKTHPREDIRNRYLLKRAERLFAELSTDLRDRLGMLLDGFEAALSEQEPESIERHREELEEFLRYHDPGADNATDDA